MKPRNHHEKAKAQKERAFYTQEELVNFGKSPVEARRMIYNRENWIAKNGGARAPVKFK